MKILIQLGKERLNLRVESLKVKFKKKDDSQNFKIAKVRRKSSP